MKKIIFLCGARDFHAMDWYRSAKKKFGTSNVAVMADIISAEGLNSLVQDDDELITLHILDRMLFRKSSRIGDIWRNLLKLMVLPLQACKLRMYYKRNPNTIFHAHGMYYMQLAAISKVPFVGTPQGSELLVRPYKSKFYRKFATNALRAAKYVTVDSLNMQASAERFSGIRPIIVQNGIDVKSILSSLTDTDNVQRKLCVSVRGFTPLYREIELLNGRNSSKKYNNESIHFVYPFADIPYLEEAKRFMSDNDKLIGRLQRDELYKLLKNTEIVFSIPSSDSSPRSVYEAIFLGCVIIISPNNYVDILPDCMRKRIVIADITKDGWFDEAVEKAKHVAEYPFIPDGESIKSFDQEESFNTVYQLLIS